MASCLLVTVILCVLITTVTIIVSFTTPNWVNYPIFSGGFVDGIESVCTCKTILSQCDCGLWLYCQRAAVGDAEQCSWFLGNEFQIEKELPVWFKSVQALFAAAAFCSLMALILGLSSLCCACKSCSLHRGASVFMNFSFLLLLSGVCTFGAMCHVNHNVAIVRGKSFLNGLDIVFGWSFWLAVAATGMALLSSLLYCGVSCSENSL
ncbi:uncharacterized protein LOC115211930 [Argonauta hians]